MLILLIPWVILGVLLAGFLGVERVRGRISLARYKRELAAKGVKLSASEFLPKVDPKAENGAPELWRAVDRLGKETVTTTNTPPRMRVLASGRSIVCFREDFWADDKVTNQWDEVFEELKQNEEALKQIRVLLQKPVLRTKIDYEGGPKMLIPHLPKAKRLTYWFGTSCQLALHDGRGDDALEDLLTQIRIPRSLAEDRILISELVRVAIAAIARTDTWEALQTGTWTEKQLERIQQAWEQQEFATAMTRALEGEIVFAETSFVLMRKSNEETASILFGPEEYFGRDEDENERSLWERAVKAMPYGDEIAKFLKHQVYSRVWRFAWLDQDERYYLQFLEELLNSGRRAAKSKSMTEMDRDTNKLAQQLSKRTAYDRLRFPSSDSAGALIRAMARAMRAETERSMTISAVAIKRFELRHGNLPQTLDSLVPDIVSSVPVDYMDGRLMRYRLNSDGQFVLYSVGEDEQDDGGSTAMRPDKSSKRNLWDRKDFVWPAPATPDEVEEYHKQGTK